MLSDSLQARILRKYDITSRMRLWQWTLLTSLTVFSFSGFAHPRCSEAHLIGPTLPEGLSIREKVLEIIGEDEEPNVGFQVVDAKGIVVGNFEGHLNTSRTVLSHADFHINTQWRKRGLSRALASALLKRFSEIEEIRGALISDNLSSYLDNRYRRLSRLAAFQETPFFKAFEPFGFTAVRFRSRVAVEDQEVLVTLRRR